MNFQSKFLVISLLALSPLIIIYLYKGLYYFGKLIWKFAIKKFPKLNYQLIQISRYENEGIIYILTSTVVLYIVSLIIFILI